MNLKTIGTISILALACTVVLANQLSDQQERLSRRLKGQVLIVRNFYTAATLSFEQTGRLTSSGGEQDWMRAQFEVGKVRLKKDELTIEGKRVHLAFDDEGKLAKEKPGREKVRVSVALASNPHSDAELSAVLKKIFITRKDKLEELVPPQWKTAAFNEEHQDGILGNPIYKVGSGVSPPRPIYTPDPEYTDEARADHYSGTVVLAIVVDVDGKPKGIRIIRHQPDGLDYAAMNAVRQWRFAPGTKGGVPVAVGLQVELKFQLR